MNYLVIDLEMCRVPKHYRTKEYKYAMETIQIGAVLLDEQFQQIGTMTQYVHPKHGVIDYYIENLTGIESRQVKNAPCLEEALEHMIDWLGDRTYKIYAWSSADHDQLTHEILAKQITGEKIGSFMDADRWIDYQAVFDSRFGFPRAISLEEALTRAEIDPEGRFHDGLDDAVNTGKLIEKLELHPGYKLKEYAPAEQKSQPLGFSLGSLLAGLDLQTA